MHHTDGRLRSGKSIAYAARYANDSLISTQVSATSSSNFVQVFQLIERCQPNSLATYFAYVCS
jgi:hypothetical protein